MSKIVIHPDHKIIETCYSGTISSEELISIVSETLSLAKTHGITLLLGDCSNLVGGHSLSNLYSLAGVVVKWSLENKHFLKEAIIVPEGQNNIQDKVQFWETTSHNHGLTVKLFTERMKAIQWLISLKK